MSEALLKQAVALAKGGKASEALNILKQYIRQSPKDARGWWLLANLSGDENIQRESLKRVLALEPTHAKAQAKLQELEKRSENDWLTGEFQPDEIADDDDPFAENPFSSPAPDKIEQIKRQTYENVRAKAQTQAQPKVVQASNSNLLWYGLFIGVGAVFIVIIVAVVLLRSGGIGGGPKLEKSASNPYMTIQYPGDWQSVTTEFNTIVISTSSVSTGDINPYRVITDLELRQFPASVHWELEYWTKYYWDFGEEGTTDDVAALFAAGLTGSYNFESIEEEDLVVVAVQTIPRRSSRNFSVEEAVRWAGQLFEGELEYSFLGVRQTVDVEEARVTVDGRQGKFFSMVISSGYSGFFGSDKSYSSLYFGTVQDGDTEYLFMLSAYENNGGRWEKTARKMFESIQFTS